MNQGFSFVREIDMLGRLVVPKDLRVKFGIDSVAKVEIIATPEGVLLKSAYNTQNTEK